MKLLLVITLLVHYSSTTTFLSTCQIDSDCEKAYNDKYVCVNNQCLHEPILPLNSWKFIGMVSIVVVSSIANLGGIGGGEIIVPIYIYFFAFTIGDAIPLSKVTILSGSIVSIFFNYNKRKDGEPNTLLVDFQLLSFIVPMMLAGTVIGVAFTKLFPPSVLLLAMVGYIVLLAFKMFVKAKSLFEKENEALALSVNDGIDIEKDILGLFISRIFKNFYRSPSYELCKPYENFDGVSENVLMTIEEEPEEEEIKENDADVRTFLSLAKERLANIIVCASAFLIIVITSILRGGKGMPSVIGIGSCSLVSWLIFFVGQACCFVMVICLYLYYGSSDSKNIGIAKKFNSHFFKSIIVQSYFAGSLAGTLGMGGGIVINPMLLSMGIDPCVSTVVSSFVVFFTSLSTTTQFFVFGAIELSKIAFILVCSGLGAFIAGFYLDKVIQKYKRPSLMVWILVALLTCSAMTMTFIGTIRVSEETARFSFGLPC